MHLILTYLFNRDFPSSHGSLSIHRLRTSALHTDFEIAKPFGFDPGFRGFKRNMFIILLLLCSHPMRS